MSNRICTIEGCERPLVAKGLCRAHYQRQWKTGTTAERPKPTPEQQFLGFVVKTDGCWPWVGFVGDQGYGRARHCGRKMGAHRAAYELFIGPVPEGLQVDHDCHNRDETCNDGPACPHRCCVNPEHLRLRTGLQNLMEGRTPARTNAAKTECIHGHAFTLHNTYTYPDGRRACRRCMAIHDAERANSRKNVRKAVPSE